MKHIESAEYDLKLVADQLQFDATERKALRTMKLDADTPQVIQTKALLRYFSRMRLTTDDGYDSKRSLLKGIVRHQIEQEALSRTGTTMRSPYMREAAKKPNRGHGVLSKGVDFTVDHLAGIFYGAAIANKRGHGQAMPVVSSVIAFGLIGAVHGGWHGYAKMQRRYGRGQKRGYCN